MGLAAEAVSRVVFCGLIHSGRLFTLDISLPPNSQRRTHGAGRRIHRGLMIHVARIILQQPRRDKYFRLLATVIADGKNVSEVISG
jgi:hypothetical protein